MFLYLYISEIASRLRKSKLSPEKFSYNKAMMVKIEIIFVSIYSS